MWALTACAVAALALGGCASFPSLRVAPPKSGADAAPALTLPRSDEHVSTQSPATREQIEALLPADRIDVELPPQPLPQMLNTVYGDILKVPYVLGPDVSTRADVITLRGASGMTKRDFFRMVQVALKTYGLKVFIRGGTVNIVPSGSPDDVDPVFLRSRPNQETPRSAQAVSQFYEARAIEINALISLLSDVFPQARNVAFAPDISNNSVVISGGSRDVENAVSVLQQLDQAKFAGVGVVRIEPVYWSADTLAKALSETLRAEGNTVSDAPQKSRHILVLAFPSVNQVLLFASDPSLLSRARGWASKLDQPSALDGRPGTFLYQAQNVDAQSLLDLVSPPNTSGGSLHAAQTGVAGAPPAATAAANTQGQATGAVGGAGGFQTTGTFMDGRVIVDAAGNRILFTGQADQFTELRKLLVALDAPSREVLVEVTIAEVTLTDQTNIGLEWFFNHSMVGGRLSGGTLGGLGLGSSGLSITSPGYLQAQFNAFASNNKVNILSRPRLVARSGSEASIQVGTDVPIITSQANSPLQTNGSTNILQTITYRQTGIILHIKPLVYGDNRIDLVINQEVSSQQANPNASIGSPLILDRNITTQLSLTDGATAVLGGLIDNSYSKGNSGVPFAKDVPILGQAFRTDNITGNKTELVMLVTPYILHDTDDMTRWAGRYSSEMNTAFRVGQGFSYTLTGISPGLGVGEHPAKIP